MDRPAAVEVAIWLNQFQSGSITLSDAVNALETITEVTSVTIEDQRSSWPEFIDRYLNFGQPVFAVLPLPGYPAGIPYELLRVSESSAGFISLANRRVLHLVAAAKSSFWQVSEIQLPLANPDLRFARNNLLAEIGLSADLLANFELQGERQDLDLLLNQLRPIYLPAGVSKKLREDLELAEKIWLICEFAALRAEAVASPSKERLKVGTLLELKYLACELMSASSGATL
jgi:hypothetical protein